MEGAKNSSVELANVTVRPHLIGSHQIYMHVVSTSYSGDITGVTPLRHHKINRKDPEGNKRSRVWSSPQVPQKMTRIPETISMESLRGFIDENLSEMCNAGFN